MRIDLLGLPLERAQEALCAEGVAPQVTITRSPRRTQDDGGMLRIVAASDDGKRLTAAAFVQPLDDRG